MRDYKKEYNNYQGKPEQLKNRATRNNARRQALKAGRVSKGDSKDVDHKVKLIKGGSNKVSNLRVVDKSVNRSFPRNKKAGVAKSGKA